MRIIEVRISIGYPDAEMCPVKRSRVKVRNAMVAFRFVFAICFVIPFLVLSLLFVLSLHFVLSLLFSFFLCFQLNLSSPAAFVSPHTTVHCTALTGDDACMLMVMLS